MLVEEWVTIALAQADAESRYRLRAADRGRTRAVGTTTPNVVEENFRCQFEGTKVADGMTLKKLQMCLLATLPFGNGLERVHVPTYETSQGMGNLLDSRQFRGRF